MAMKIVDLHIKHVDLPKICTGIPEGIMITTNFDLLGQWLSSWRDMLVLAPGGSYVHLIYTLVICHMAIEYGH